MAAETMKSFEAGSNITLKKGISCPDNGEGLRPQYTKLDSLQLFSKININFSKHIQQSEFYLKDKSGEKINLKEVYEKTQNDGKLQRIIYNIYYVLLTGM